MHRRAMARLELPRRGVQHFLSPHSVCGAHLQLTCSEMNNNERRSITLNYIGGYLDESYSRTAQSETAPNYEL